MVFSSMTFIWIFLPILLFVYYISKEKYRNIILLIFSLIFYSWGEPKYIILMLISILVNYIFGRILDKCNKKKNKTIVLIFSIIFNLGLLVYFKYFNFIATNIDNIIGHNVIPNKNIVLPIGISFYTFQIMSYIIDLYFFGIK